MRRVDFAAVEVEEGSDPLRYRLRLVLANGADIEIDCPVAADSRPGFEACWRPGRKVGSLLPIPARFAVEPVAGHPAAILREGESPRRFSSDVDVLGLLGWSAGLSAVSADAMSDPFSRMAPTGWSLNVPSDMHPSDSTLLYTDALFDAFAEVVGADPQPGGPGPLLVTGDTDCATEDELVDYLETVSSHGGSATLLIREPRQLTDRVLEHVGERHDLGIHPYAASGSLADYVADVGRLASAVREASGRPPIAARNHRFQWFRADVARRTLAEAGVRIDLNLVAASGSCWLGTPTGISLAAVESGAGCGLPLWLLPTVVEDEVFIYDVRYGFGRSRDWRRSRPTAFVCDFLEHWLVDLGLPAIVNFHPEHSTSGYRRLQDAVLAWAQEQSIPILGLRQMTAKLDQEIIAGGATC